LGSPGSGGEATRSAGSRRELRILVPPPVSEGYRLSAIRWAGRPLVLKNAPQPNYLLVRSVRFCRWIEGVLGNAGVDFGEELPVLGPAGIAMVPSRHALSEFSWVFFPSTK
jgi:hypothetical protein